jgi:hypothetical protein
LRPRVRLFGFGRSGIPGKRPASGLPLVSLTTAVENWASAPRTKTVYTVFVWKGCEGAKMRVVAVEESVAVYVPWTRAMPVWVLGVWAI